ncbi:MAG: hypothetical protein LCH77_04990 [Actinobacteria bacterium]|nr:hypothetical protein [Actinomycetota bacterium]
MAFWQNRIARVWPVHIATLHIDLVTSLATGRMGITEGGHRRTLTAYLQNLAMVQNWFNDRPQLQRAGLVHRQRMVRLPLRARPLPRHRRHPAGPHRGAARRARVCRDLLVFAAKALPNGNVEHMFYVRIGGEFVGERPCAWRGFAGACV